MGLLYKDKDKQAVTLETNITKKSISLEFCKDCGKFGTEEVLDRYTLTNERLLEILQAHSLDDYTEEEIQ